MSLPTSLVERRKWRASVYYTQEYFDFLCLVESIFVANLMLTMMLAYNDGNIVAMIKTRILAHKGTKNRFLSFSGCDNNDDDQLLLGYILERYANMQGTFFIKHLKRNSANKIQKLANSQTTRTQMAHVVVNAKKIEVDKSMFASDDVPEC